MKDVNIVVLVGRLTRDAELKYTNSGMPICRFSVAVNRSRKQGDQWVEEASFFDVDYWGKGGEAVNQYLTKGKQVAVEGELRQDKWEQDGQSRSKVVINANNVQLLGSAGGGSGAGSSGADAYDRGSRENRGPSPSSAASPRTGGRGSDVPAAGAPSASREAPRGAANGGDDFTDDIPF